MTPLAQRRLAAILAADVVGYSRLMEHDEAGTLATLKAQRNDVLEPLFSLHQGRIFKVAGDSVMVEFASAVSAVRCAIDVQQKIAAVNADKPEHQQIVLRIGVNLGDVMVDGSDLYGDGVNVAVRLEGLAEPGGICVTSAVRDQVERHLPLTFEDLGEQTVKNIARPLRVCRVVASRPAPRASVLPFSGRPSIAVLPFTNMSGDPEQQYFSDGITEDIITELSRFRQIFVIASNSSFQFRDRALDIRRIGQDLGVEYVLEGSVRRAGGRVRVTAQLIEAATGSHLWAEHYDRNLADIFAVQDEVTKSIVGTLFGQIEDAGAKRAQRKHPESLAAYDYLLRGIGFHQSQDVHQLSQARATFEKAIEADPHFAVAHAWLALACQGQWDLDGNPATLAQALANARKAVALDDDDARCHVILSYVLLWSNRLEEAEYHQRRALALNPNDANIVAHMGLLKAYDGSPEEAIRWLDSALRLDPYPPFWYRAFLGVAHYVARDYVAAARNLNPMLGAYPWDRMYSAATYAQLGQIEDAGAQLAEYRALGGQHRLLEYAASEPYRNPDDLRHLLDGLRKAGVPE